MLSQNTGTGEISRGDLEISDDLLNQGFIQICQKRSEAFLFAELTS